jgi:hypothetical protein
MFRLLLLAIRSTREEQAITSAIDIYRIPKITPYILANEFFFFYLSDE